MLAHTHCAWLKRICALDNRRLRAISRPRAQPLEPRRLAGLAGLAGLSGDYDLQIAGLSGLSGLSGLGHAPYGSASDLLPLAVSDDQSGAGQLLPDCPSSLFL